MGGKWIIYVGIHNSYLRNTGTVGIMQPGSIRKRCYYFILGCRSPLSFPFILPWNLFRYVIDHSRGAKKCCKMRKHVKMCQKTGTLAKHYCHQSRRSAYISTAMARLGLFLCIALPVFCSLYALSGYNSQIAPNRVAPQLPQRIVEELQGVLYCTKRSPKTHRTVRTKSISLCFSSTAKNTCKK